MDKEFLDILKDAFNNGLCKEYRDEIRACHEDKLQLVRLAVRQQSCPWIATKMYDGVIKKEYILKTFGKYLNGYVLKDCDGVKGYLYSWFVDWDSKNDIIADVDVLHISHTVGASVIIPQSKCPVIYVSNDSDLHIICDGFNSVVLYLFDHSKVTIDELGDESSMLIYKYSDNCCVEQGKYCFGNIKEHNKELRL